MLAKSFPVLGAQDMGRAKAYYTEKLGLDIMMEADLGIMFQLKDGTGLLVYPHSGTKGTSTVAGFFVDDLAAEMKELRGRGVKFEDYDQPGLKTVDGVAEFEGLKSAWFVDTEGNILSVGQMG